MWNGSSPNHKWEGICLVEEFGEFKNFPKIYYDDEEWMFLIESGDNYYLGMRKNFSKPCLPFIQSTWKKWKLI